MSQQLNAYAIEILSIEENKRFVRHEVKSELLFHFESDTEAPIKKLVAKKQEWKNLYGVVCYSLTDSSGNVTKYQYKRMPNETEGERWYYQNKKRSWQQVEDFDVTYDTVNFALTGRSY